MTAPPTTNIDLAAVTRTLSRAQLRSVVEAIDTPQMAIWSGAVSSGKTIASLLAWMCALADAPEQGHIVIVGRTRQTIERNIIDVLAAPALFGPLARYVHHTRGADTATILGRTVHLIGASNAASEAVLRGLTVALAYVDEITLIHHDAWLMLLSRLRVVGAKLLGTTNPGAARHWLRTEVILRAADVDARVWHFVLDDNPGLDPAYVTRLKIQYVGMWYQRYILGRWVAAEGAIYDMWDPDRHTEDTVPIVTRWPAAGVDYGTSNPFHAIVAGLGVDRRLHIASEWRYDGRQMRRQLTHVDYSRRLREWLAGVPIPTTELRGVRPEIVAIDPSEPSFRVQCHRDGLAGVWPADNAVLDGIRTVSSLLAMDALRIHSSCTELIGEIGTYAWDPKATARGDDEPLKEDDHGVDALRYALFTSAPRWRGQVRQLA